MYRPEPADLLPDLRRLYRAANGDTAAIASMIDAGEINACAGDPEEERRRASSYLLTEWLESVDVSSRWHSAGDILSAYHARIVFRFPSAGESGIAAHITRDDDLEALPTLGYYNASGPLADPATVDLDDDDVAILRWVVCEHIGYMTGGQEWL